MSGRGRIARWSLVIAALGLATVAPAQRGSARVRSLRDTPAVAAAFADVVARVRASVVVVEAGGRAVAYGTVVSADGIVVTKASELADAPVVCVVGDRQLAAVRIGTDDLADLAVLKVDGLDTSPAPRASSVPRRGALLASPLVGEMPVAVGILSSAPYPNSGERAYLGVQMYQEPGPVRLQVVHPETAASRAGLAPEDVIVAIDDAPTPDSAAVVQAIRAHRPGDQVQVRYRRGDDEHTVDVTLLRDRTGARSTQEGLWGPLSTVRAGFGVVLAHDAILRPEQCGGPLVDLDGAVVGVNIARAGRVETLALPIDDVLAAVERLRATGGH